MEQLAGYIGIGAYMTKTSFPCDCAILPQEQFDKCEQLSWSLFQQRNSIVYKYWYSMYQMIITFPLFVSR